MLHTLTHPSFMGFKESMICFGFFFTKTKQMKISAALKLMNDFPLLYRVYVFVMSLSCPLSHLKSLETPLL